MLHQSDGRFAGRTRELAVLTRLLSESAVGRTVIADVRGDPGLGKSRLLAEFGRLAREAGAHVVTAIEAGVPDVVGPLVVLADDAHLDDAEWADAVTALARRPRRGIVLVLARRPRQTGPALTAALTSYARVELALEPLAAQDFEPLCEGRLDGEERERAHRLCAGNPGRLALLLEGPDGPAASALLAETARLREAIRLVAQAAAVAGDPFEPELVARVADVEASTVLPALDELLAADVVRPGPGPASFVFRSPALREVTYRSAPAGWRIGAHRRAADALREDGQPAVRFAEHVERAGRAGDGLGAGALAEAAAATEVHDPATAAGWYAAALRLLPEPPAQDTRRRGLLTALARTSLAAGRTAETAWALAALPAGDPDAALIAAGLAMVTGREAEARRGLQDALARMGPGDDRSSHAVALAETAMFGSVPDDWAAEAVLAASRAPELVRAHALALHALARLAAGDPASARRSASAAAELTDRHSDDELLTELGLVAAVGWAETHLEDDSAALRHFDRGIELARSAGRWPALVPLLVGAGTVYLRRGRQATAREHAATALRLAPAERAGSRALVCWLAARVALAAADPQEALSLCQESLRTDTPLAPHLRSVAAAAGGPGPSSSDELPAWAVLDLAEAAAPQDADGARRALDAATGLGLPGQLARAELLAARFAPTAVEKLVRSLEALRLATAAGHHPVTCRAQIAAALASAELGDPDRAAAYLDSAQVLAEQCSSAALAASVAAARGETATPAAGTSFTLSQREFQIAKLVSEGRTNRQIARTLGVSHKTVETHLSRIFGKLEVSSRSEIASLVGGSAVKARPRPVKKQLENIPA
ncbi:LuxR C-terminal-related transcriptional regulator [Amycolatopsis sp. NPDC049253]|uniref:helix-turn-helix transcriptional regulator n=1 Tax=Amycolatopsis sp. NPDC049253 TaxID=3155274 RepID=UPI003428C9D6